MSERQQSPYDSTARKWLALVERRQQSFIELGTTGRWRHYYTHAEFVDEMGKVLHLRNQWARLAGVPVSDQTERLQNIKLSDRRSQDAGEPQINPLLRSGEGRRHRTASAILAAVASRF
jgi:hypothetical protein